MLINFITKQLIWHNFSRWTTFFSLSSVFVINSWNFAVTNLGLRWKLFKYRRIEKEEKFTILFHLWHLNIQLLPKNCLTFGYFKRRFFVSMCLGLNPRPIMSEAFWVRKIFKVFCFCGNNMIQTLLERQRDCCNVWSCKMMVKIFSRSIWWRVYSIFNVCFLSAYRFKFFHLDPQRILSTCSLIQGEQISNFSVFNY